MSEAEKSKEKLEFKWLYPDEVQANPLNWREHPVHQTEILDALIFGEGGVGWAGVALVNNRTVQNGWLEAEAVPTLIDGHDRQKIATARNEPMPVIVGEWTPEQERTILTTFDPVSTLAKTNTKILGELLSGVRARDKRVQDLISYVTVKNLRVKEENGSEAEVFANEEEKTLVTGMMPKRIYTLNMSQLIPNNWSAHAMSSNEFNRLKQSIQKIGVIEPLIVRPLGDGKFEIVDGMQRYRALLELGMTTVDCLIRQYDEDEAKLASLASNRLRGKFIPKRLASILTDVRDTYGDELVVSTIGMEKKRMDSFGDVAGYEFNVSKEGVLERDYREYGTTDYTPIDSRLTLIIALPSEDFHYVEEVLNDISPNWSKALPQMAREWREYARPSVDEDE